MRKAWNTPKLEVLDVKETMWNLSGTDHDGAWTEHLSNLHDNGDGTSTESQMS